MYLYMISVSHLLYYTTMHDTAAEVAGDWRRAQCHMCPSLVWQSISATLHSGFWCCGRAVGTARPCASLTPPAGHLPPGSADSHMFSSAFDDAHP